MSIYDRVLPTGDLVMGGSILFGAAIAVALDWVVRTLRGRVMAYIGGRTEYVLGSSVFERILNLPSTSTEGASVSRQVGRIKNLEGLRDFFLGPLAMLAFDLPATLIILVAVLFINAWIVPVMFLSAMGFAPLGLATKRFGESSADRSSRNTALRWEMLNETLINMRAIRTVGAERKWIQRFRDVSGKSVLAAFNDRQAQSRIGSAAQVLGTCTGLLALAASVVLAIEGALTGGAMMATVLLVWRLTGPMQNIFMATTSLSQVRGQMRQVENLMRLQTEREGGTRQTIRPAIHGSLSFSRVSFRYANDADPALLGVSFAAQPGELVVITGPNASGKSSLLKLVVRAYVPQAGTIRLDSIDIRQLTAADLRSRISYMLQHCELYYGTVAQNLRLAHPAATDEELRWAAAMAGVLPDIEALPEGFATRISNSRSDQLPHGFRQRLSLARTMLKPAAVVLLDEPGAGMDQDGEDALLRCLEWLRGRSTVLMVSQRPGHMRLADHVIYLEKGAVVAMGKFDEIKDKIMSGMRK
ncbi:MAG: ATP-binding cassette domain-containing protein [Rhodocyclales bacterium]|nr:ATP-binding cassette domain-containing protein [Rhodocyclales bacterium]